MLDLLFMCSLIPLSAHEPIIVRDYRFKPLTEPLQPIRVFILNLGCKTSKPAQDGNMTDRLTKMRISYPLHYRLLLTQSHRQKKKKKKTLIKTGADCCRSNKHSVTRQPPVHKPLLVKAPKPKTQAVITSPHPPSLTMLSQFPLLCNAMPWVHAASNTAQNL